MRAVIQRVKRARVAVVSNLADSEKQDFTQAISIAQGIILPDTSSDHISDHINNDSGSSVATTASNPYLAKSVVEHPPEIEHSSGPLESNDQANIESTQQVSKIEDSGSENINEFSVNFHQKNDQKREQINSELSSENRLKNREIPQQLRIVGEIQKGLVILLGIHSSDNESVVHWLAEKIVSLRIFPNSEGKMNLGLEEIQGEVLVVSQFTLYGDCQKGRRPSFVTAAQPEIAKPLYRTFIEVIRSRGVYVAEGEFGADMQVELVNDGPVTLILEKNA